MKTEFIKLGENTKVKVSEDTQFVLDVKANGGDLNQSIDVVFEKSGVSAEIIGVFKLLGGEEIGLRTSAIHKVPNTQCFTHIKGVLMDKSSSNYVGKIIIEKDAQQTSSYLEDNILVVGEGTNNISQPILEIEADDVRASHGATTGRINKDQLFYLQSRGLSEEEAQEVIIEGFLNSLLNRIQDETIRNKVKERLNV